MFDSMLQKIDKDTEEVMEGAVFKIWNEDTNESAVHELTWEEYEDQQRKRQEDAENQASSFGISATELSGNADSGDAGR